MEKVKAVYVDFVKSISFVVPESTTMDEIYDMALDEGAYYTYDDIKIKVAKGEDENAD